jgi:tripartite-type tricarboxylate transporter receptor subunit TctC
VLAGPKVKERFEELGIQITPLPEQSPEALRAYQKQEADHWWPVIKASGIKAE